MGLFERWRKPRKSREAEDNTADLWQVTSLRTEHTPIGQCQPRHGVTIVAKVLKVDTDPETGGELVASVGDGTGEMDLIWHSRRTKPSLLPGQIIIAKGTVGQGASSLYLIDPQYSIQVAE